MIRWPLCVVVFLSLLVASARGEGATFYVATTGNDSNSCSAAQSISTPKRYIGGSAGAFACTAPGDTVLVRAGTYPTLSYSNTPWKSGTATARITISAYQTELVTISGGINIASTMSHLTFKNLKFNGSGIRGGVVNTNTAAASYIRIEGCEIYNGAESGILLGHVGASNWEIVNNKIHHNGTSGRGHGLYISSPRNLIDGNDVYSNASHGMQVYNGYAGESPDSNTIRNNRFFANGTSSPSYLGYTPYGIMIATGVSNLAYNNLVYNMAGGGIGTCCGGGSTKILNNTIYGNSSAGRAIDIQTPNAVVKNNILHQNGSNIINNGSTGAVISSNLTSSNPLFVNPSSGDFRLQATSPAIDSAAALNEVTFDFIRVPRPQGGSFDIGAYEYGGSSATLSPPAAPTNVRVLQ